MLVLSRKCGERFVIRGEELGLPGCLVTVTVVAVEGGRVRLGIAAPAEVVVTRAELVGRSARRIEDRG
jgi:carbon storage regulator CsrA